MPEMPVRLTGADAEPTRAPLAERAVAASGAVFVALFVGGLLFADLVASETFPTPTRPVDEVTSYFRDNRGAVRALSVLHAFAALALMVFAAYVSVVLRTRARSASGVLATLAAAGGAASASFLLLDAALFWVLALPSTTADEGSLRAVHALSYLAGGVGVALPLALLIGATTVAMARSRWWPRGIGWLGAAATVEALLYGTTLVGERGAWSPSGVLVVFITLPLVWIGLVSLLFAWPRRAHR